MFVGLAVQSLALFSHNKKVLISGLVDFLCGVCMFSLGALVSSTIKNV